MVLSTKVFVTIVLLVTMRRWAELCVAAAVCLHSHCVLQAQCSGLVIEVEALRPPELKSLET